MLVEKDTLIIENISSACILILGMQLKKLLRKKYKITSLVTNEYSKKKIIYNSDKYF